MPTPHQPFAIPENLVDVEPSQVVGSRSTSYGTRGLADTSNQADAGAKTALNEHRQPPDSQYLTTGLPSGGILYPSLGNNSLGIRRFNNDDVLKIYDARAEQSFRMLVEVIGATLDNFSVWELTVGDFWFLLYWHRVHSYPKSPFVVDWTCSAEKHVQMIRDQTVPAEERVSVESLEQRMILKRSDLRTVPLEPSFLLEVAAILHEFGVTTTVMRMDDYCRLIEMEEENEDAQRAARADGKKAVLKYKPSDFLAFRHASKLARIHGATLEERRKALMTLSEFSLWPKLDNLDALGDHGVVETYKVRCAVCQTESEVEVALDALTFLPEL